MPIYEYECRECGYKFEVMQKVSDRPIRKCEQCGRLKAKRIVSRTSFVLKGSGWYVTDYGGKNVSNSKSEKPETSSNEKSSGEKDSSGDAKAKAASA
jgi:putative FmdB family regulatory protein